MNSNRILRPVEAVATVSSVSAGANTTSHLNHIQAGCLQQFHVSTSAVYLW